jgi:excisionase family DNA binding protein
MKPSKTALPTIQDSEEAKVSSRTLSKYAHTDRLHLKVLNPDGNSDDLVLPGYAVHMLMEILTETSKGNAITIMPIHAELTTQQAAEILNVSRPHLVHLLESNQIPFTKVGAHRRVLAKDVFEYKDRVNKQRLQTLDELTAQAQELGMGYE